MKILIRCQTALLVALVLGLCHSLHAQSPKKYHVVYILVDQWRAQSFGFAKDPDILSPNLDRLAKESLVLTHAVSGMPVCSPHRASFLTGQYPLSHGVFMNDVLLDTNQTTIAKVFKQQGYQTAFWGKWHVDGHGRSTYIPPSRQQGFDLWKALECTHDYNHSAYYEGGSTEKKFWQGYDALEQLKDLEQFIQNRDPKAPPFFAVVSIGSPHDPYQTAPEKFKKWYEGKTFTLRPNVPTHLAEKVQQDLRGYYAHISAIDEGIGKLMAQLKAAHLDENTLLVFTSDHGDLLGSHGVWNKQQPYDESIRVPFILHLPALLGRKGQQSKALLNSPDIMPTLLGLLNIPIPKTVEGKDFSGILSGKKKNDKPYTLISCVQPFGQWPRAKGGKEYRGISTERYTYVRDLAGPWLLFDREKDPYQLQNMVNLPQHAKVQKKLDHQLKKALLEQKDEFLPGLHYVKKWNYVLDATETVPYTRINYEGKPINDQSSGYPQTPLK